MLYGNFNKCQTFYFGLWFHYIKLSFRSTGELGWVVFMGKNRGRIIFFYCDKPKSRQNRVKLKIPSIRNFIEIYEFCTNKYKLQNNKESTTVNNVSTEYWKFKYEY